MEYLSRSPKDTWEIASEFVGGIKKEKNTAVLICLYGDLGSGKTTFVKGVAKAFGVKNEVISPTFIIEKIYKLSKKDFKNLIHIDAYRLDNEKDLSLLGWQDIISDSDNIIFLEWPERISKNLSDNPKNIYFEFINETDRKIKIDEEK